MTRQTIPATPALRRGLVLVGVLTAAALATAGGILALATPLPTLPPVAGRERIDRARELYLDHELPEAERLLRELLQGGPEDREAKSLLGCVLLERGRLSEAEEIFESLLKSDPRDVKALRGVAQVLRAAGRPGIAVQRLQAAAELRTSDPLLWKELGLAQRDAGDALGAFHSIQKSLTLDSAQADLSILMSDLLKAPPVFDAPGGTGRSSLPDPTVPSRPEDFLRHPNRPRPPGYDPLMPGSNPPR